MPLDVEVRRGPVPGFRAGPDRGGARLHRRPPAPLRRAPPRPAASPRGASAELDAGVRPDFLAATRRVREDDWTVAPAPADLDDRRVEITGPAEPKMMINALNSGARVFMADLEDALSPTWANVVGGQAALIDAVRRELAFDSPEGKTVPARTSGRRPSWSGRAAGTWSSPACWSTAPRSRPACSTSGSSSSTTARRRCDAGAARTSTWPSSRATPRRDSGTTSSSTRRRRWASRAGRSGRRC